MPLDATLSVRGSAACSAAEITSELLLGLHLEEPAFIDAASYGMELTLEALTAVAVCGLAYATVTKTGPEKVLSCAVSQSQPHCSSNTMSRITWSFLDFGS